MFFAVKTIKSEASERRDEIHISVTQYFAYKAALAGNGTCIEKRQRQLLILARLVAGGDEIDICGSSWIQLAGNAVHAGVDEKRIGNLRIGVGVRGTQFHVAALRGRLRHHDELIAIFRRP